jgi:hypothetical protein
MKGLNITISSFIDDFDDSTNDEIYVNVEPKFAEFTEIAPDVVTNDDTIKKGDLLYFVWVEYSIGDSCSKSHNYGVEKVAVFRSKLEAIDLYDALMKHNEYFHNGLLKGSDLSFLYYSKDGQVISIPMVPWYGYFDHLENVHISEVVVI